MSNRDSGKPIVFPNEKKCFGRERTRCLCDFNNESRLYISNPERFAQWGSWFTLPSGAANDL